MRSSVQFISNIGKKPFDAIFISPLVFMILVSNKIRKISRRTFFRVRFSPSEYEIISEKMMGDFMSKTLVFLAIIISLPSYSLVDYSPAGKSRKVSKKIMSSKRVAPPVQKSLGMGLAFGMETVNIVPEDRAKVDLYRLSTVLDMPLGLNFSASMLLGSKRNSEEGMSMVNSKVEVGVNWINFGNKHNRMTIDFLTGAEFSSTENGIGHQRNDYYFGVQTHKQLGNLLIGLGADLWMPGKSDRAKDNLDGLTKMHFSLGLNATNDIRFDIMFNYLSFKEFGENLDTFSYLEFNPNLTLMMSRSLAIQIGGRWSSSKQNFSSSTFSQWSNSSIMGNSIYTSLNFFL